MPAARLNQDRRMHHVDGSARVYGDNDSQRVLSHALYQNTRVGFVKERIRLHRLGYRLLVRPATSSLTRNLHFMFHNFIISRYSHAMTMQKKYGLIGAGMMGYEHIMNMALVDGVELVAMSDTTPSSLTAGLQICAMSGFSDVKTYSDPMTMIAKHELDAIIVATPNFTHYEIVSQLMDLPIALLVEKPLCTTVKHARDLAVRAKNRQALFWTGLEYRYMPPVAHFIKRVHSAEAGDIRMLSIREHRFPFLAKVGDWNRFNENTGGTLTEKCCHFFDLMRVIMREEPTRIFASGAMDVNHKDERYAGRSPDILDNAYVIVDFESGARAALDLCMFADGSEEQEEIYALGDIGKLEVKIPSGRLSWSPRVGFRNPKRVEHETVKTDAAALKAGSHHGSTFYQLSDFHHALCTGGPATVTALDGLRSVEMGAAAHRSIETGLPVTLDFKAF